MNTNQHSPSERETASNVQLPEPGEKRVPVGIILIVLWVVVFLTIFLTLGYLKLNPPNRQGPVLPDANQSAPAPTGNTETPGRPTTD